MADLVIRDIEEGDYGHVVKINLAEVRHTSPMDTLRLKELLSLASFAKVVDKDGELVAFILAMREGRHYENDNYRWFSERYPRFLYIDRIVVGSKHSGLKIGSRMYEEIFKYAREEGLPTIVCEINIVPPNEASRRFHEKLGFREIGTQWLKNRGKKVSMQAADLA